MKKTFRKARHIINLFQGDGQFSRVVAHCYWKSSKRGDPYRAARSQSTTLWMLLDRSSNENIPSAIKVDLIRRFASTLSRDIRIISILIASSVINTLLSLISGVYVMSLGFFQRLPNYL